MHNIRPAKITSPITTLSDSYSRTMTIGLILGAIGVGLSAFFGGVFSGGGIAQFIHTYLVSFCSLLTMSLGCLFLVLMLHLTRAGWGVTVRRIAELFAMCLAPLFILALPIILPVLLGQDVLYPWVAEGY